jgi:hypothetical protein
MKKKKNSELQDSGKPFVSRSLVPVLTLGSCWFIILFALSHLDSWFDEGWPSRNQEIPALQTELNNFTNQLLTATNDTLLLTDQVNSLRQFRGCIQAITDFYYGTNRSFDDVIVDFDTLLVGEMNWRKYENMVGYSSDEKITVSLFQVTANDVAPELLRSWEQYLLIYRIRVVYNDPSYLACEG